jgi:hypothetical protein
MTVRLRRWFSLYLTAWMIGSLGLAVSHLLFNKDEAAGARWGHSPGWQRDLGLFNVAIAFILAQTLRRGDEESKRTMVRTALVLYPMVGANHVSALRASAEGGTRVHWTGLVLSALTSIASSCLLLADRRQRVPG